MNERYFQHRVMHAARWCGWQVAHFHDSRLMTARGVLVGDKDAAGFPDLTLAHPGLACVAFAELKSDTGRLRPAQADWIRCLHTAGAIAYVWRPRDWPRIEHFLKTGKPYQEA